ncbi:MAG TPA: hypothetical protein VKP78_09460 [bacterium]|nr:hypothetical protein [bacterium]
MLRSSSRYNKSYAIKNDLEDLLRRLEEGMIVKGRVLEHVKNDEYLIRIRGYNIYTESEKKLQVEDKLHFKIIQTVPHLILNPYYKKPRIEDYSSDDHTDIIVN